MAMKRKRALTKTIPIAPGVVMRFDGRDCFIVINGVKVAKRGRPNSPEARTWIALDPRFEAFGDGDEWSFEKDGGGG
jgi:hypothetical protein